MHSLLPIVPEDSVSRYRRRLAGIPAPGSGNCHTALLGVANLGCRAGVADDALFTDIRAAIPDGTRPVFDSEIRGAIKTARRSVVGEWNGGAVQ